MNTYTQRIRFVNLVNLNQVWIIVTFFPFCLAPKLKKIYFFFFQIELRNVITISFCFDLTGFIALFICVHVSIFFIHFRALICVNISLNIRVYSCCCCLRLTHLPKDEVCDGQYKFCVSNHRHSPTLINLTI